MLKRLLFGNEDRLLRFKTSPTDGIARLYTQANIPPADVQYWQKFWTLFETANDVFTLLSVADVRRALIRHPENIATLVAILIVHLEVLQDDDNFSPIPSVSSSNLNGKAKESAPSVVTSVSRIGNQASSSALSLVNDGARRAATLGSFFGASTGNLSNDESQDPKEQFNTQRDRQKEALNCCRILTRILPVLMEGDHDATCNVQADGSLDQRAALESDSIEEQLMWSTDSTAPIDIVEKAYATHSMAPMRTATLDSANQADDSSEDQFVIEDNESDADDTTPTDPLTNPASSHFVHGEAENAATKKRLALGERLVTTTINLLFYSGFSIPWAGEPSSNTDSSQSAASHRIQHVIWEKGIGSSVEVKGQTRSHEANRLEVLRLLLVTLSKSMFVAPNVQAASDNRALRIVTTSLDRSTILPMLCSLLNVSVVWVAKKDGWLGSLASLPAGLMKDRLGGGNAENVRQATVSISMQLLNVLLSYESLPLNDASAAGSLGIMTPSLTYSVPGTPRPNQSPLESASTLPPTLSLATQSTLEKKDAKQNLFRYYFAKLHRQADFALLSEGIMTVLAQRPSATALFNPAAALQSIDTSVVGPHVAETLLILWRLLRHNGKYRTFLLDNHAPQLLGHLLFHALNNKDNTTRQGMVRLIVFVLHDISCDRAFAVNICKAGSGAKARVNGSQRWGVAVGGGGGQSSTITGGNAASGQAAQASTGADILVQSIYALIASTKSTLSPLYSPMMITLTNISPYFKGLSILSANRLLALFNSFSNPAFLLADENNPRVLYYLIETLNNVIQHGFQRNANVTYAIVRNHRGIERLANFTLRRGIAEIRRSRRRTGMMGNVVSSPRGEVPSEGRQSHRESEEAEKEDVLPRRSGSVEMEDATRATSTTMNAVPASEKARGKMRRSSTSSDTHRQTPISGAMSANEEDEEDELVNGFSEQELYFAASTVGRNGFVPTQTWVTSWHKGLPLDVLQITVVELVPQIQQLCSSIGSKSDADERVLAWLREQDLSSVLPSSNTSTSTKMGNAHELPNDAHVPTPQPRAFKWTPQVSIWLLSYMWGLVYVSSTMPYGLFNGLCSRLFQVRLHDARRFSASSSGGGASGDGGITSDRQSRSTASSNGLEARTENLTLAGRRSSTGPAQSATNIPGDNLAMSGMGGGTV